MVVPSEKKVYDTVHRTVSIIDFPQKIGDWTPAYDYIFIRRMESFIRKIHCTEIQFRLNYLLYFKDIDQYCCQHISSNHSHAHTYQK